MRVDAHQHFWRYDPSEYRWIDDRMEGLKRDYLPKDIAPLLAEQGFGGTVAVQARHALAETEFLLGLADSSELVLGVVGWVDLRSPGVARELERFRDHPRFKGVRHIVQDEPDDGFLLWEDFCRGIAILGELELPYDILVYPRHLPVVLDFVRRFPHQRFVLDHLAKPDIRRQELEPWASQIRELARSGNLWCKISGMATEADWEEWKYADFEPYLDVVFEAFGVRRLLFGSDWPVAALAASYAEVVQIVLRYLEPFSEDERDAILGDNAVEFYRLGGESDEA